MLLGDNRKLIWYEHQQNKSKCYRTLPKGAKTANGLLIYQCNFFKRHNGILLFSIWFDLTKNLKALFQKPIQDHNVMISAALNNSQDAQTVTEWQDSPE